MGVGLVVLSVVAYVLHYIIFKDVYDIFFWLLMNIAFVFINVLLVTLIIEALMTERDKRALLKKMNMVIGSFYSEVGTELLRRLSPCDPGIQEIAGSLEFGKEWSEADFEKAAAKISKHEFKLAMSEEDLERLREHLVSKRPFMLGLLLNPNLLEHESFTELLWGVFHLTEELSVRGNLAATPDSDRRHLESDGERVYALLVREWLSYMKHLKTDYPYLFSLAIRTNPFDTDASPVVR